jgi:hypothetical protein
MASVTCRFKKRASRPSCLCLSILVPHAHMADRSMHEKQDAESFCNEILPPPQSRLATRRAAAFILLLGFLLVVSWTALVDQTLDSDSDPAVLGRGWIGRWVYATKEWQERIGNRPAGRSPSLGGQQRPFPLQGSVRLTFGMDHTRLKHGIRRSIRR